MLFWYNKQHTNETIEDSQKDNFDTEMSSEKQNILETRTRKIGPLSKPTKSFICQTTERENDLLKSNQHKNDLCNSLCNNNKPDVTVGDELVHCGTVMLPTYVEVQSLALALCAENVIHVSGQMKGAIYLVRKSNNSTS